MISIQLRFSIILLQILKVFLDVCALLDLFFMT